MTETYIKKLLTAQEAKALDRISIDKLHMPSLVLMERAALALSKNIMNIIDERKVYSGILILCGFGNNGADGVASGRILRENGYDCDICIIGDKSKYTDEMLTQIDIAANTDIELSDDVNLDNYDIIVDCLFGVGLSKNIDGIFREYVEKINESGAYIISADIPSGIHATTGKVMGVAVKADVTVTFGLAKRGVFLYPGVCYSGEIFVEDVGFPEKAVDLVDPVSYTFDIEKIREILPKRGLRTNKGTFGKVTVIAGSKNMSGACFFAAKAAYRTGCGLVHIITAKSIKDTLAGCLPEAVMSVWDDSKESLEDDDYEKISDILNSSDAVVIGPGLGNTRISMQLLRHMFYWHETPMGKRIPVIIDADGLNLLSKCEEYFETDKEGYRHITLADNFILTPHLKEMSRLCHLKVNKIAENMSETVRGYTEGCVLVLKDAGTLVANDEEMYINLTGNNALSTAGAGDVLAGMIAGFAAQGEEPVRAASLGVCMHGLAADSYVKKNNPYSMMASDILEELQYIL